MLIVIQNPGDVKMTWKKTVNGKRKKELPNRLKKRQTISFRSNLSQGALGYIKRLALQKEKSEFINKAIEMGHYLLTNKERFISEVIEQDFQLAKRILRKVGSRRSAV